MIAVLLSTRATAVSANQATRKLHLKANKPEIMLLRGIDAVKNCIKTIGLYNSKAENMIKTCTILHDKDGKEVPKPPDALEALPNVGRKTASVVLNTAFGEPTMAFDTHIFRLANRTQESRRERVSEKSKTGL